MKTLSITLCFLLAAIAAPAAPKYPVLEEVHGKIKWTDKDGKVAAPKAKQTLIEKAALETEKDGVVVVQIDAHRRLKLLANSRVEFPAISWETGDAPVILLKFGSFRWKEEAPKSYNIALRSDLFEFLSPVGDFVFTYDPKNVFAEVRALSGSMEFSAMNAEDVALVTAGQKVRFQGVRESDEIVYDVLLKGKKIPRGKLGLVEPLSDDDIKTYSGQKEKQEQAAHQKKIAEEKKAREKAKDPQQICDKPGARLNQCAWTCENNLKKEKKVCHLENPEVRCVRRRCNANGEWSEETEISKDKAKNLCGLQPNVKECDY
jgi:hypothetical protein